MEVNIISLIKKLKVAHRNLQTATINDAFIPKDIDFDSSEEPQLFHPDR